MSFSTELRGGPTSRQALSPIIALLAITVLGSGCKAIEQLTNPEPLSATNTLTLRFTPESLPVGGGDVEVEATVHSGGLVAAGVEVTFETTAGDFPNGNRATTDGEGKARVTLRTTRGAQVTASISAGPVQIVTSEPRDLSVGDETVPDGTVQFDVSFSAKPANVDESVVIDVVATHADGSGASGTLKVEFGDGRQTTVNDFQRRTKITHTYRELSTFNVVVALTDASGQLSRSIVPLRVIDGSQTLIEVTGSEEVNAREDFDLTVRLRRDDGRRGSGNVTIDWGDGRSTKLGEIAGTERAPHSYREQGSYRITAQVVTETGRAQQESMRIRVLPPLSYDGSVSVGATSVTIGDVVTATFEVTRSDGRNTAGTATIDFGQGTSKRVAISGNRAVASHAYSTAGNYTISGDYISSEGKSARDTVRVEVKQQVVEVPNDDGGGGGGGGNDAINVGSVNFLNVGVGGFKVTSTVSSVSVSSQEICIRHSKAGNWPSKGGLEGNPWIIANIGGQWYGGSYEWLRPGQVCKRLGVPNEYPDIARALGPHIKASPMTSWVPKSGDTVYLFVTSLARAGVRSVDERSNIVKVIWP